MKIKMFTHIFNRLLDYWRAEEDVRSGNREGKGGQERSGA